MRKLMNDYPPSPKDKVIGIKVDLKKLIKLIKQLFQKKSKKQK